MAIVFYPWSSLTVGNVLLSVLFLLLLHYLVEIYQFRGMPPGPRLYTVPFFGNFLSFDGGAGKSLRDGTQSLMKRYGKVFSVRLGSFKVVIAASADSVKEVLIKRYGDYAGRPPFHTLDIISMGRKTIAFANVGLAWKLHRKLFVTALRLYLNDTQLVERRIIEQGKRVLQFIHDQNGKAFDPNYIVGSSVANLICRIAFGNLFNSSHPDFARFLKLVQAAVGGEQFGKSCAFWDFFPVGKYLPIKAYRNIKALADEVQTVLREKLQEREKSFESNFNEPIDDFISALIKTRREAEVEDAEEKAALLSEDHLIGSLQDMFTAGYETTTTTLRWAIAYLVNFPEYQTKVQQELDDVVGRDRFPSLDDRPNLPFLQAFIMEVQRLSNVLDNTIPYYTVTDTALCGYRVPKDTVVLVNLEAVHLDPECWGNPSDFNPNRHIDADGKLITGQRNWVPFSAGRRNCAGESLAKVELFLFLSIMLQRYTFVPEDEKESPSLKGAVGFLVKRPRPYQVSAVTRT